jgi:hypothetical protein
MTRADVSGSFSSVLYEKVTHNSVLQKLHNMRIFIVHNLQAKRLKKKEASYFPRVTWHVELVLAQAF